jgi:hypothetical protein
MLATAAVANWARTIRDDCPAFGDGRVQLVGLWGRSNAVRFERPTLSTGPDDPAGIGVVQATLEAARIDMGPN